VAAGLAPIGLASDGGGSIRIPSACCGLFGLKPQRGRVSLAPFSEHWYGLSSLGAVSRSALDAALFLDAVADVTPGTSFVDAARGEPGRLRVAFSLKTPARVRMADASVRALNETADLLRSLGHDVVEHDPEYGEIRHLFGPRWLRGIYDDSRELVADRRQLERRTRQMAGVGRLYPTAAVEQARRGEASLVNRLKPTFDSFDVLLCPGLSGPAVEAGRWEGMSALRTFLGVAGWAANTATWNITGQPAAAVPAGFTPDGLPLSVQIVGRKDDETTLIALAAQLERERSWTAARPEP
jgi:amidase